MSIAFDRLCLIVPLAKPTAAELSTSIGVGPWGWPSSSRATRIGHASRALMNVAPTSASMAELITALIIFDMV